MSDDLSSLRVERMCAFGLTERGRRNIMLQQTYHSLMGGESEGEARRRRRRRQRRVARFKSTRENVWGVHPCTNYYSDSDMRSNSSIYTTTCRERETRLYSHTDHLFSMAIFLSVCKRSTRFSSTRRVSSACLQNTSMGMKLCPNYS